MKPYLPIALGIAAAIGISACGATTHQAASNHHAGVPSTVAHRIADSHPATVSHTIADSHPVAAVTTASVVRVHFDTPQAAMRYLADAWNRGDIRALHHVTTPTAFSDLMAMHSEAVNLKLQSCAATKHGDYICHFQHRYPKKMHDNGYGASDVIVAPAINPGWYMYALLGCG